MNISVIGTGYVGLVTGTCFAETGNDVICMDNVESKVESLNAGKLPFYEPGLEELVKRNIEERRLRFVTSLEEAVRNSLVIFITVGTPMRPDDLPDLSDLFNVARDIGRSMTGYRIVANKSTVPVGTGDKVREIIAGETEYEFDVVSCPEFLKEGAAVDDFMKPDRVVIGVDDEQAAALVTEIHSPFVRTGNPVLMMDVKSAELTKYVANAMLATRISLMNEVANFCEKVGANVNSVRQGVGTDSRIGHSFLFPGVGYGGSCFPKDIRAIIKTAEEYGCDFNILRSVEEVNARQKEILIPKILTQFGSDLRGTVLAVWGLSFKPRTDDMREAPSITIINRLLEAGAAVKAYDPVAGEIARSIFGDSIEYCSKNYDCLRGADGLLIVTEWQEFRHPNFEVMKNLMRQAVIFDGRNIYDPKALRAMGFEYFGVGQ